MQMIEYANTNMLFKQDCVLYNVKQTMRYDKEQPEIRTFEFYLVEIRCGFCYSKCRRTLFSLF